MRHSVALFLSISTLAMASTTNDTHPLTFKYPTVPVPFPTIHHPFPPRYNGSAKVVPTNAWLSNLFYPSTDQMAPITSDPYTLRFLDGNGNGVSVVQKQEKIVGGYAAMNNLPATEAGYLTNQVAVDLRLSGLEWISPPDLTVVDWDHFGATVQLASPQNNNGSFMHLPVARGMAYVTAHYHALTPRLFSQHTMLRIDATLPPTSSNQTVYYTGTRFKIAMDDPLQSTWLIYCLDGPLTFAVVDASTLVATAPYTGTIRVAKLPRPLDEAVLDQHHDVWTTGGTIEPHEK
jgi:endo-1,3(4)-beta-glucanase